jgi:hypothetical protein
MIANDEDRKASRKAEIVDRKSIYHRGVDVYGPRREPLLLAQRSGCPYTRIAERR